MSKNTKKEKEVKQSGLDSAVNTGLTVRLSDGREIHVKGMPFIKMSELGTSIGAAAKKTIEQARGVFEKAEFTNADVISMIAGLIPSVVTELAKFTAYSVEGMTEKDVKKLPTADAIKLAYGSVLVNDIALMVHLFFVLKTQVKEGLEARQPDWLVR